jgi:hypothetical protein
MGKMAFLSKLTKTTHEELARLTFWLTVDEGGYNFFLHCVWHKKKRLHGTRKRKRKTPPSPMPVVAQKAK